MGFAFCPEENAAGCAPKSKRSKTLFGDNFPVIILKFDKSSTTSEGGFLHLFGWLSSRGTRFSASVVHVEVCCQLEVHCEALPQPTCMQSVC